MFNIKELNNLENEKQRLVRLLIQTNEEFNRLQLEIPVSPDFRSRRRRREESESPVSWNDTTAESSGFAELAERMMRNRTSSEVTMMDDNIDNVDNINENMNDALDKLNYKKAALNFTIEKIKMQIKFQLIDAQNVVDNTLNTLKCDPWDKL